MSEFFTNEILLFGIIITLIVVCSIVLVILNKKTKKGVITTKVEAENKEKKKEDVVIEAKKEESVEALEITDEHNEFDETNDLDDLLKTMELDIIAREEDEVKNFEFEQEEKSIISYTELFDKKTDDTEEKISPIKMKKIKPEPVVVEKLEIDEEELIEEIKEDRKESKKPKKKNEFISPVYGRQENKVSYPTVKSVDTDIETKLKDKGMSLEDTLDINKLNEEIKKNTEFLQMLKEFRNNLE